jgi:hypothetical protein
MITFSLLVRESLSIFGFLTSSLLELPESSLLFPLAKHKSVNSIYIKTYQLNCSPRCRRFYVQICIFRKFR